MASRDGVGSSRLTFATLARSHSGSACKKYLLADSTHKYILQSQYTSKHVQSASVNKKSILKTHTKCSLLSNRLLYLRQNAGINPKGQKRVACHICEMPIFFLFFFR